MSDQKSKTADQSTETQLDFDLTQEELLKMLQEKTLENAELHSKLNEAHSEVSAMKIRTLKVHEENVLLKASPDIASMKAMMDYQLMMAKMFIESGAFPDMTPEQAYTLIKAGGEMGLKEIESLRSLYIVKGAIKPWGNFMAARMKEHGYSIEYIGESKDGVVVRVFKEATGEEYRESAEASDPTISGKQALKYARFNKLRYHALRKIVDFHLPHLFSAITDTFSDQFTDEKMQEKRKSLRSPDIDQKRDSLLKFIARATTVEQLQSVYADCEELDLVAELETKFAEINPNANEEQE